MDYELTDRTKMGLFCALLILSPFILITYVHFIDLYWNFINDFFTHGWKYKCPIGWNK